MRARKGPVFAGEVSGEVRASNCGRARTMKSSMAGSRRRRWKGSCEWQVAGKVSKCRQASKCGLAASGWPGVGELVRRERAWQEAVTGNGRAGKPRWWPKLQSSRRYTWHQTRSPLRVATESNRLCLQRLSVQLSGLGLCWFKVWVLNRIWF